MRAGHAMIKAAMRVTGDAGDGRATPVTRAGGRHELQDNGALCMALALWVWPGSDWGQSSKGTVDLLCRDSRHCALPRSNMHAR